MVRTLAELEDKKAERLKAKYPKIVPVSYGCERMNYIRNVKKLCKVNQIPKTELFFRREKLEPDNLANLRKSESVTQEQLTHENQVLFYIEKQAKLFDQVKHELLDHYEDKYVLFENGNVLDFDEDREKLAMRSYEKYGMKPLFIEKVSRDEFTPEIWTPFLSSDF
ncbi:MAG TPA: hypothetical protein DCL61_15455 [Cyanobacteria bacterium UBA12227]|nr:hypothetical protein [Cyanobacteria bacterium UBA12227]HAX88368.1 hypothetical protein [Cyanobacteria bacterium UBA11370]HBY77853.1 hypothetical protein [Cyanobacteria bacterium UBA11148]